jgi:hypothetical protein
VQTSQDNHFMHAAAHAGEGRAGDMLTSTVLREFAGLHHVLSEVHGAAPHACRCWLACALCECVSHECNRCQSVCQR